MAYEIGVATDYKDLLARMQDFLNNPGRAIASGDTSISELQPMSSGEFWQIKRWNTNYDGDNGIEMILQGLGSSGDDEIYIGVQTYYHAGDDYYNWRLQGFTGYSAGQDFDSQPGAMTDAPNYNPKVTLWNSSIPYWFVGNGRRFAMIAKVSTVYVACYMGFLLPYGIPNQIPYPLAIGGSSVGYESDAKRWSGLAAEHRNYYDTSEDGSDRSSLRVLNFGTWIDVFNYLNTETAGSAVSSVCTWPYMHSDNSSTGYYWNHWWELLRENIDDSYPLFPVVIHGSSPEKNIYGELQGIYAIPGFGVSAEDEIEVNGDRYIVTQNVHRTGTHVYMAMKLE
jgi:hypothetical protein